MYSTYVSLPIIGVIKRRTNEIIVPIVAKFEGTMSDYISEGTCINYTVSFKKNLNPELFNTFKVEICKKCGHVYFSELRKVDDKNINLQRHTRAGRRAFMQPSDTDVHKGSSRGTGDIGISAVDTAGAVRPVGEPSAIGESVV